MELLFDPMFRMPFATGLLLALLLPGLGMLLRLRREWLAALGFAHLAGAGGTLATVLGAPALVFALALAVAGVLLRGVVRVAGNDFYALMILAGWAGMILAASFSHHAQSLGQMLVDGQLYFVNRNHMLTVLALGAVLLAVLPFLRMPLLRMRLFPGQDRANGRRPELALFAFNVLLAGAVALAAMTMGVMAAFAMLFVPPWIAWGLGRSWREAGWWALGTATGAYVGAFALALVADLPFGPVLTALLVALTPLRLLVR